MSIKTIRIDVDRDWDVARCVEHDVSARGDDLPDALRELARILELVGPERIAELPPAPAERDVPFVNRVIAVGRRLLGKDLVTLGEALDAIEAPTWRPIATVPTDGRRVLLRWSPAENYTAVVAMYGGGAWRVSWTGETLKNVADFTEWAELPQ